MSTVINVDVAEVAKLVGDLDDAAEALTIGVARAVNTVATHRRQDSVRRVVSQVNLPEQYVDQRITIEQDATPEKPVAVIAAPVRGTLLTRFGAVVETRTNDWTKATFDAKFGAGARIRPKPGAPELPWTPRRGDPLRGIPSGSKAAGVAVSVKAGGAVKSMPHAFLLPLRNGNGMGVLTRPKGGGKPKVRYGPSVDQVVRGVWRDIEGDIADELDQEVLAEVSAEVDKRIAK